MAVSESLLLSFKKIGNEGLILSISTGLEEEIPGEEQNITYVKVHIRLSDS
jgi:hypothetical protein